MNSLALIKKAKAKAKKQHIALRSARKITTCGDLGWYNRDGEPCGRSARFPDAACFTHSADFDGLPQATQDDILKYLSKKRGYTAVVNATITTKIAAGLTHARDEEDHEDLKDLAALVVDDADDRSADAEDQDYDAGDAGADAEDQDYDAGDGEEELYDDSVQTDIVALKGGFTQMQSDFKQVMSLLTAYLPSNHAAPTNPSAMSAFPAPNAASASGATAPVGDLISL
eukprot:TRINITY_DN2111_c0_g1::TRINITY_DN2111_c0_g1_i1::g.12933::m.12933 TRINITY_DN2111_c0_g1::TRINITY_DN2111_c0_g1_i1::g.12933  ORF type:complete len:228 (-),score=57.70 TRINITY_DN2111_c0_g1_i1:66-749(-)